MSRALIFWLYPLALLGAMAVSAVAQTTQEGRSTDPRLDSLRGAKGTVVGDREPRFGDGPPASAGTPGKPPPVAATPGGPGGPADINPADPKTAGHIREWIHAAEPPQNVTEGADFRYTYRGNIVGTTIDGGIIRSPHETGTFDAVFLWRNKRSLESVNHCTMEEYVLAKLAEKSTDHCRGRYKAAPSFKIADYTHQPIEKVKQALAEKKLKVTVVKGTPAPAKKLETAVEDQEPEPGTEVRPGRLVTLTTYTKYEVPQKDRERIDQAIASCRFDEAKRLIDDVDTDDARQPFARAYDEGFKREERTKALYAEADELYRGCDYEQARTGLKKAADTTRCEGYRTKIRAAQDKINAAQRREQKTKDLFTQADEFFKSCNYEDALTALSEAHGHTRCDRYRTKIEDARKTATSAAAREEKTKALFGEADRLFKICEFDEARAKLNSARQNTRCGKYAQKIEVAARKIDAGASREDRTKSLFEEADHLFKQRNYSDALSRLNTAKANTKCDRYVSQINGAIAKVQGSIGKPPVVAQDRRPPPQPPVVSQDPRPPPQPPVVSQDRRPPPQPSVLVGLWVLHPAACTGAPPPPTVNGNNKTPGNIGEAIVQGLEEGIEEAIMTMKYQFSANGDFSMVTPEGGFQKVGSWLVQDDILTMKINNEDNQGRIVEKHADRFVMLDLTTNERATFYRCGATSDTTAEAPSQDRYDCGVDTQHMAGSDKFCDSYVERLSDFKWIHHIVNKDRRGRVRLPSSWKHGRYNTCEVLLGDSNEGCAKWKRRNRP